MVVSIGARPGTQSVERAFAVLRAVATGDLSGIGLADIMKAVGLNRTTTYRMLKCLVRQGAVRIDRDSAKYYLGPLALELGSSARHQLKFAELFSATLTSIAEKTGDTAFLLLRSGNDSVCIDRRLGAYPVKTLVVDVGTRRPLGVGAAGLAMLQALPEGELQQVVRVNAERYPSFGTSSARVLKGVRAARALGYVSARVHGVDGVRAVALPITDMHDNPIAGVGIAAVAQRMARARQGELVKIVQSEIKRAERLLETTTIDVR